MWYYFIFLKKNVIDAKRGLHRAWWCLGSEGCFSVAPVETMMKVERNKSARQNGSSKKKEFGMIGKNIHNGVKWRAELV